jgi:glutathione synthase/RimK-type ligase-like ATP-grasp enzyme
MTNKILVFGGNIRSSNYLDLKSSAKKMKIKLDLVSYKQVCFDTKSERVLIENKKIKKYDVYFFRNTKNYWEEINLITDQIKKDFFKKGLKKPRIIDPLVDEGRSSDACKAHQMMVMSQADLPVPQTIYGTLDYLKKEAVKKFKFPLIIKGSKGDRKTQVFKIDNKKDFLAKIKKLNVLEKEGENEYMLQEYIENDENFRVMVLGNKILGVMKRSVGKNPNLKDVFEKTVLPLEIKKLAIKAAKVCEITIAGVDVVFRKGNLNKPLFFEVNKTPGYKRFQEVTKINVSEEIVKFLSKLK